MSAMGQRGNMTGKVGSKSSGKRLATAYNSGQWYRCQCASCVAGRGHAVMTRDESWARLERENELRREASRGNTWRSE